MKAKKVIITGGPGTGKSTLINELIRREYTCYEEISRQITIDAKEQGTDQLFLTNPLLFSELLLKERLEQFKSSDKLNSSFAFFDRGIPDILAYMDYIGTSYPDCFINTCKNSRYNLVFILKPWKSIYKKDNERYEDFIQAKHIHEHLTNTYKKFNYKLINVPFDTPINRINFILNYLNS